MLIKYLHKMLTKYQVENFQAFLFGILGAAIVFIISHCISTPAKQIGTVNITGIVDQYIQQQAKKGLPSEVLKEEVKEFGKKLELHLKQLAQRNHLIILPSEAVIAGANDYTDIIDNSMR